MGEIGIRRAIQLGRNHEIRSGGGHGEDRVTHRCHSGCHDKGGCSALQCGDTLLEDVVRGIIYAVVVKSRDRQVHDRISVFCVNEVVGYRHIYGYRDSARAVRLVASVDRDGLVVHGQSSPRLTLLNQLANRRVAAACHGHGARAPTSSKGY